MSTAYEAGRINRSRATKAEMEARYDALAEIIAAEQPTGIRFVYYTATARGLVPKNDHGYDKVQRAILAMRRAGRIPYPWIVDSGRWMRKPTTWGSLEEMLESAAKTYRRALWERSGTSVEVWCESESVAGVLYPVTSKWDVPLYPIKGQTSDSFAWGAAQQYRNDDRELVIYYVGDHDPHGYEIESNLRAKLAEFSDRDDIYWSRVACDESDVEQFGLTGSPPKKTSWVNAVTGEREPWHGDAVEVEALSPVWLRQTLDEMISEYVDADQLRVIKEAEKSEREALSAMAVDLP